MPADFRTLLVENIQPRPRRGGWHGGPTPIGAVRGLSPDAAAWQPAPGRNSIWALVLHIAYWKYAVRRKLEPGGDAARFARSPANFPSVPEHPSAAQWSADVALLRSEHERLIRAVAAIPPSRYGDVVPGRRRWTVGELIVGIAQHDAYHTGQIQLLKRLWEASSAKRQRR